MIGMSVEIQFLLDKAVKERVTCGAALAIAAQNAKAPQQTTYFSGYCEQLYKDSLVDEQTVFDLASLTKPLVTVLSVASLVERGLFDLNSTVSELFREYDMLPETARVSLKHLLAHCSGLPAYRPYYVHMLKVAKEQRAEWLVRTILTEPHQYQTGKEHVYSDLGYILLGKIVEIWSGKSLDVYFKKKIAEPLGLQGKLYFTADGNVNTDGSFAYTEVCPWSHTWLNGSVNDDNCRVLGGVAGHAGLFGTLDGVSRLCSLLREIWSGRISSEILSRKLLRKLMTRVEGSTWCYGFDSPSAAGSSSGKYFSAESVGHLGFTGTSFWIDLARGISIVLLTNRVHPSRSNDRIRAFRPLIHDTVMEKLLPVIG